MNGLMGVYGICSNFAGTNNLCMNSLKQTVMITGSTDGLGRAVAFDLAEKGYSLILHGRNENKGKDLVAEIIKETGNTDLFYYNADFAHIDQIKQLAQTVIQHHKELNVLINNAGLGVESQRRVSADGYEMIFQVDYLSTYILTKLLTPLLESSAPSRVVNVASAGQAPLNFADPLLEKHWDGVQSYCQAKLAQIALAVEWGSSLLQKGVTINALHPASYMPTKIVTHMFRPQSTVEDGVASVVNLVTNPSLNKVSGKYFNRLSETRAQSQAYDAGARAQLLQLSQKLTGV
jgi:NAD(P)-dependent dehydrogenase (short-subunit alcohol dehydrogenase family)